MTSLSALWHVYQISIERQLTTDHEIDIVKDYSFVGHYEGRPDVIARYLWDHNTLTPTLRFESIVVHSIHRPASKVFRRVVGIIPSVITLHAADILGPNAETTIEYETT